MCSRLPLFDCSLKGEVIDRELWVKEDERSITDKGGEALSCLPGAFGPRRQAGRCHSFEPYCSTVRPN